MPTKTPSRRGRPPGSGRRAQQVLALVGQNPGITIAELAAQLGINVNYLYRVCPQLEKQGKIVKKGKGYEAVYAPGDAVADAPTPVRASQGRPPSTPITRITKPTPNGNGSFVDKLVSDIRERAAATEARAEQLRAELAEVESEHARLADAMQALVKV